MDYLKLFKELGAIVKGFDPRPDLAEDSHLWCQVLDEAERDKELFGLLHGLRCGGAKLEVRANGSLKLDYRPLLGAWDEDKLLKDWLNPNKNKIGATFKVVAERMRKSA